MTMEDVAQIMECNLDSKTILQIIENLCIKLKHHGEDYVMMTTNPLKQTSDVIASNQGREFMKQNANLLQNFVNYCYNATSSSSSTGYDLEIIKKVSKVEDFEDFESNGSEGNEIEIDDETMDSEATEDLDLNEVEMFFSAVQGVDRKIQDIKTENTGEQNFKVEQISTTKFKVCSQPNKKQGEKKLDSKMFNSPVEHSSDTERSHSLDTSKLHEMSLFKCEKCNDSFETKTLLKKHVRKIHNQKLLVSKKGTPKYSPDTLLGKKESKQISVDKKEKKKCTACSKSFQSKYSLQRHMNIHQKKKKYQCGLCKKIFWRSDLYKNHLVFHKKPKYKCQLCEKKFYLKKSLARHIENCHKKEFECKACMVIFRDRENYELHSCEQDDPSNFSRRYDSGVTEDGKHICGICKKVFPKRRGLLVHRKLHSAVYTSHNSCGICNKSYRTKNSLRKHVKVVHTDSRDFICDLCGKSFKRQDTLNSHKKTHESKRAEYRCTECDKCLSSPAGLKVHMKLHQKLKPFMCDICGMSFTQRGNLAKHMLSHTDKTNFKCEQCGKEFKYHETWKTHMRSHALKNGLQDHEVLQFGKFYVCQICQKKVASASQYKVHMRTHTNERPYTCKFCGKCFKESGKLSRHMKVHSNIKHVEHNYVTKGRKAAALEENAMASNSISKSNYDPHNAQFCENSYTGDGSRESVVAVRESLTNENQIQVIDDGRHQFLMHQLAPVKNLIMESTDGRQIQVPSTEMQIMGVDFNSYSRTSHSNQLGTSHNQMIQRNPTTLNNLMPITKF